MSIANFSIAGAAIAQSVAPSAKAKTPPKRRAVARADAVVVPEPR